MLLILFFMLTAPQSKMIFRHCILFLRFINYRIHNLHVIFTFPLLLFKDCKTIFHMLLLNVYIAYKYQARRTVKADAVSDGT
jgi:hypothetical protein